MPPEGREFSPEPLQSIVERLAEVIGRSVAVDDAELRLLAHSTHFGDADPARVESLVGRSVTPERTEWARQAGVLRATSAFFTDAAPELGLRRRYVAPVRVDRELAALIWIIDDETLTPADLDAVARAAEDMRTVLVRRAMTFDDGLRQVEAQVLALLSDRADDRLDAAEEIAAAGILRGCAVFQALSLALPKGDGDRTVDAPVRIIARALAQHSTGSAVARTDQGVVVLVGYAVAPADDRVDALVQSLHRALDAAGIAATVGVGSVVGDLGEVLVSHEQADCAARVAGAGRAEAVRWDRSGLDGMLAALLPDALPVHLIPRELERAMQEQSEDNILAVRTYLANAGNVVQTGADLHLHRTTVYYRLGRFSETTGLDLADGDTRLMLQLWFRMAAYVRIDGS
ncbi:PucR family transcriptional regulator [Rathayibacter sp. Leaf296]|uniref:PucR family transcriptional regulator n=1 Tax=Rathayibacter sp. Leaf296 TaxID=1736327 RepID=UPI000702C83D|nr:PucR family transcriptional regulator [Rathayibacter sp. Leaf296]KQQ08224.1 hypothetical protein ASF46_12900 [Rathayibacter sp. Leaf296]